MAGNKKQAKQIVAEILFVGSVEFGFKICHGGFLLGVEFAAELFVFALEKFVAAKMIERAMLGGSHQPGAGIVRYAGARPFFERGDQSVLRKFFGQANIANEKWPGSGVPDNPGAWLRSEEHTLNSSHQIISYAVFCL